MMSFSAVVVPPTGVINTQQASGISICFMGVEHVHFRKWSVVYIDRSIEQVRGEKKGSRLDD